MRYVIVKFELGNEFGKDYRTHLSDAGDVALEWARMHPHHEAEVWLDYENEDFCWEEIMRVRNENGKAFVYQTKVGGHDR